MNRNERLKKLEIEDFIWYICIILILLSIYGNTIERDYFLTNNEKSKKEYLTLQTIIFSIAVIIYLYYFYDSLTDYQKLNSFDSQKKKTLTTANLLSSALILLAGIILLFIIISDDNLETEIAFT